MILKIRDFLLDSAVKNLDVNSVDITVAHREMIMKKKMLKKLFEKFYHLCIKADQKYFKCNSTKRLEIGSGSSFIKAVYPEVLTSDIKPLPFTDLVCSAENIPFGDNELRSIIGINVFHHIPNPRLFFKEALRVLEPGGGIVLIEPYYGPFANFLFKHLHSSENFIPDYPEWETATTGPMSNANQALSYIIFKRDLQKFNQEFPDLEIVKGIPHTHLWYLLSGGVNFRQVVPNWGIPIIKFLEFILTPLDRMLCLQHTIIIRKVNPR